MTLHAGRRYVGAGERELGLVVVEDRARPFGRGVAGGAVGREAGGLVGRLAGLGVVALVARDAGRGFVPVDPVRVAVVAGGGQMRAGQRELGRLVVEPPALPGDVGMTPGTVLLEPGRRVVRAGGLVEFPLVTCNAIGRQSPEDKVSFGPGGMAVPAIHRAVGPFEREPGQRVGGDPGRSIGERAGVVAVGALDAELASMDVLMATGAGLGGLAEDQRFVARSAGDRAMAPVEREPVVGVVERLLDLDRSPAVRGVTGRAGHVDLAVRVAVFQLGPGRPRRHHRQPCGKAHSPGDPPPEPPRGGRLWLVDRCAHRS